MTAHQLRVVAPPPLIFLVGFAAGALMDRVLPLAPGYAVPSIGSPLALAASLLDLWAAASFRRARTTILPWGTARMLVPGGPYRFSRNPMYLGMLFAYLGLTIAIGSWWALPLLAAVLVVMHLGVIRREEAHLEARFGAEYVEYKRRVRRWL